MKAVYDPIDNTALLQIKPGELAILDLLMACGLASLMPEDDDVTYVWHREQWGPTIQKMLNSIPAEFMSPLADDKHLNALMNEALAPYGMHVDMGRMPTDVRSWT